MGSQRVRHKWMTNTHTHTHTHTFTTPEHPASLPVNTRQQGNHDADFHLHRSVLLVSEFNITGIKQFIFFSDWFLSLSIKHVQRIHGASLVGQRKIRIHLSAIHSVQVSRSVVSNSLWPHESQHARPPCPSPTPGVHSNSRPLSQWCHPAIILCRSLFLLPPIPPSIRVFSNESTLCTRWPKYWGFNFSIFPSKEHPGLISFKMDWLDLLAVQGTLKSLLQHHSSKASILQC